MSKHTPGPWEVDGDMILGPPGVGTFNYYRDLDDGTGRTDHEIICSQESLDPDQWSANARLIAAAPELYEALRCAIELGDALENCPKELALVKAALAAVEGKPRVVTVIQDGEQFYDDDLGTLLFEAKGYTDGDYDTKGARRARSAFQSWAHGERIDYRFGGP